MIYVEWYLAGIIIAYIITGLWGVSGVDNVPPQTFYLFSWLAILCMFIVISTMWIIKLCNSFKYKKIFYPEYVFKIIKDKYDKHRKK